MNLTKRGSALKVCRTCRYWSDKYKGTCTLIKRGTGQFWMCDEWLEITADAGGPRESDAPETARTS